MFELKLLAPAIPIPFSSSSLSFLSDLSLLLFFSWLAEEFGKGDSAVKVIAIDPDDVSTIRVEFRESGSTESVIYPDLDGLGREMNQIWEDRK